MPAIAALRHTKIVATLGPASDTLEAIRALAQAGVSVFRLNFSHGLHADHARRYQHVRQVEQDLGRPLAVLQDLQGPKLRIGLVQNGRMTLSEGQVLRLDLDPRPGDAQRVSLPHPEVLAALHPGTQLLIDDGKLRLRVRQGQGPNPDGSVETVVEQGGDLQDRKGVNLPDALLRGSVITPKDRADLDFGLALGVDWVAMSFVQTAADVAELRQLIQGRARIIAKIEKPQAIIELDAIADIADALMVARGDLAVETSTEQVPVLQRRIIQSGRSRGKPVVVATQMLESMISLPVPTRAEASDVANAVYQGVDAVMLSAESASGQFALEAVQTMDRIIRSAEADPQYESAMQSSLNAEQSLDGELIPTALRALAQRCTLAGTVSYTCSGSSVLKLARERPASALLAVTPAAQVARQLNLVWGVTPWVSSAAQGADDMLRVAQAAAQSLLPCRGQAPVAVVGGLPFGTPGALNFLHLLNAERAPAVSG